MNKLINSVLIQLQPYMDKIWQRTLETQALEYTQNSWKQWI